MKKKGFNLIEMVFVIALVAVLLSIASLSGKKIVEDRAVEEAKNQLAEIMKNYSERSYLEGEIYTVTVNHATGILVVENSGGIIKERVELPDILEYDTNGDGIVLKNEDEDPVGMKFTTEVESGDDDKEMEVTIKDSSGDVRHKVEMLKNELLELVTVNVK